MWWDFTQPLHRSRNTLQAHSTTSEILRQTFGVVDVSRSPILERPSPTACRIIQEHLDRAPLVTTADAREIHPYYGRIRSCWASGHRPSPKMQLTTMTVDAIQCLIRSWMNSKSWYPAPDMVSEGCYTLVAHPLRCLSIDKPVAIDLICFLALIHHFVICPVSILHLVVLLRLHHCARQKRYRGSITLGSPSSRYKTVEP